MSDDGPDFGGSGIGDRGTCDTGRGGSGHGDTGRGGSGHGNPGSGGAGTGEAGLGGSGHGNPEPGGYPSIIGEGDQRNIFYRGKPLYPASDPAARARKRAENAALQENTLYLFPSPLLGYGTEILLKRLPAGSFLLLLECDRELDRLCGPSLQSLAEKTDRALYFFAPDNIQFEAMLSELELTRFRRVESISLSGGYRLFSETYRSFHRQAHEAIRRRWRNRMTLTHMGRLYVRNLLWNLPAYAVQASAGRNGGAEGSAGEGGAVAGRDGGAEGVGSGGACGSSAAASGVGGAGVGSGGACGSSAAASGVGGAEGAGGERPVVVFGAGESAEAAVRLLKESGLRESFTVMAVDTALPVLAAHGLCPDVVVAVEAQAANAGDFIGCRPCGSGAGEQGDPGGAGGAVGNPRGTAAAGPDRSLGGQGSDDPGDPRGTAAAGCCEGYRLLADCSSYPPVIRAHRSADFFLSDFLQNNLTDRLDQAGLLPRHLPPLGSVGVSAVYIALLHRAPVLMAGLDFGYLPGKTHAAGSPAHRLYLSRTGRLRGPGRNLWELGVDSEFISGKFPYRTTRVLRSYRDSLAELVGRSENINRCYYLAEPALQVELPVIGSQEQLAELVENWDFSGTDDKSWGGASWVGAGAGDRAGSGGGEGGTGEMTKTGSPAVSDNSVYQLKSAEAFLASEIERIDRLEEALAGRKQVSGEVLLKMLNELDYLALHFPDPEARLETAYLKRVRASAAYYRRIMGRIMEQVGRSIAGD